ncbi:MAG TPA: A24 family peptidase [Pseudogracilibacillus sp.]|nr:A24 family peptidase [Pseudogracilibacillus sp.]
MLGSLFNVIGIRLPKGEPFGNERSYCPSCYKQLKAYELIPLMSYMLQMGKCRHCKVRIPLRYLLIELATGLTFLLSYLFIGIQIELLVALLLMSMLAIVFITDINYMLIPNRVLYFFLPFFIVLRILSPLDPIYDALIGGIVGYFLIAIIIIISNGGMGAGDMKLFGVLGIVLGWKLTLLTFFFATLFGAVVGIILRLTKKNNKNEPIPFGPHIVLGTIVTYFYGDQIIKWYINLL